MQCHISRNLPERLSPCHRNGPTTLTGVTIEPTTFGFDHRCLQFTTELQGQTKVALGHVTSRQMITNKKLLSPWSKPGKIFLCPCVDTIGHFRVPLSFYCKASLRANSLLGISVFIHIEINTNYHKNNLALRLALKERQWGTQKWCIL